MSLSTIAMNQTLRLREQLQARHDAAAYALLPAELKAEPLRYWHVERRSKRKVKGQYRWIFVRELFATKSDAAEIFVKHYRGRGYRLHHIYVYG